MISLSCDSLMIKQLSSQVSTLFIIISCILEHHLWSYLEWHLLSVYWKVSYLDKVASGLDFANRSKELYFFNCLILWLYCRTIYHIAQSLHHFITLFVSYELLKLIIFYFFKSVIFAKVLFWSDLTSFFLYFSILGF